MKKELEIKYVEMPISFEAKREFNRQGYRVVDIAFQPEEVEPDTADKPRRRRKTVEDEE